jgi:hypothetical protein
MEEGKGECVRRGGADDARGKKTDVIITHW